MGSVKRSGKHLRLVEKSLPSPGLLSYIGQRAGTQRLMSFHQPFLNHDAQVYPQSDILLGKPTPKVTQHRHDQLSVFGVGTDLTEAQWRTVTRQLLAQGLLNVEGEYGTLGLTERSAAVLRGEQSVRLRTEPERRKAPKAKRATASAELAPEAQPVFEALRSWRGATAKEQGVPAYVVFHDATLREIAARRPTDLAALGTVSGVGENKLAKYGEGVLAVLADHA